MKMNRILAIISLLLSSCFAALAQQPDAETVPDSLIYVDVFGSMPVNVTIHQSPELREAVNLKSARNASRMYHGYRIRLFFDNRQGAREKSSEVYFSFMESYPGTPAYRVFDAPFFKVTVGNFRTRAEALAFMNEISGRYPAAFIVREDFRFPDLCVPEKSAEESVQGDREL